MFVAIIGTRFSGKTSIENYLVSSKGFSCVRLLNENSESKDTLVEGRAFVGCRFESFKILIIINCVDAGQNQPIYFSTPKELLDYVTENWRKNFVTCDFLSRKLIEPFTRRPFFLILQCNAPMLERFRRSQSIWNLSMADFLEEDDRTVFGTSAKDLQSTSLNGMADLVNIIVINSFPTLQQLHAYLDRLDLLDSEHLRPSWDSYFMTLASLASRRSNCMKRRVGAILIRQNRVLATGYNGTPRGLRNCNEGGCPHCNLPNKSNLISNECLCLHAEENALLEAGRERVGNDCVLYCNTCPCLKCTIKIIQTGVKTVVYNLTYKVDDASARLFEEAGVELRRFDPNRRLNLLPEDGGFTSPTP